MASNDALAGKVAIVTGAGSGLGHAMTLGLAQQGASVAAVDIDEAAARRTASAAKGLVVPVRADVRSEQDCAAAIARTTAELGGLHVLVNCAGLGMATLRAGDYHIPLRFWEVDPDRFQRLMDVNVRGPFLMARAAVPHLTRQGWGRIVNVTTSFNTMIRAANMPYGQSKAALEAASAAWAGDLDGTGVTVNVLVPGGAADTAMIPASAPYDRGKLIDPQVMVAPLCWLASDAANGVTGRRFIGRDWDAGLPAAEAMARAGAPVAWPELAASAGKGQSVGGDAFVGQRPAGTKP